MASPTPYDPSKDTDWKKYFEERLEASWAAKRGYVLEAKNQLSNYFATCPNEEVDVKKLPFDEEVAFQFLLVLSQAFLNRDPLTPKTDLHLPYVARFLTSDDPNSLGYEEEELMTSLVREVVVLHALQASLMQPIIDCLHQTVRSSCYLNKSYRDVNLWLLMVEKRCLSGTALQEACEFARYQLVPAAEESGFRKTTQDSEFLQACVNLLCSASAQLTANMPKTAPELRDLCKLFGGFLNASFPASVITTTVKCIDKIAEMCGPELTEEILIPPYFSLRTDCRFNIRKACVEMLSPLSRLISDPKTRRYRLSTIAQQLLHDDAPWVRAAAYEQLGRFILTFAQPEKTGLQLSSRNHVERIYPDQVFHPLYRSPLHSVIRASHSDKLELLSEHVSLFDSSHATVNGGDTRIPHLSTYLAENPYSKFKSGAGRVRSSLSCSISSDPPAAAPHRMAMRSNARPLSLIETSKPPSKVVSGRPKRKRQYSAGDSDGHGQGITVADTIHALHRGNHHHNGHIHKHIKDHDAGGMKVDKITNETMNNECSQSNMQPHATSSSTISGASESNQLSEEFDEDLSEFTTHRYWSVPLPKVELDFLINGDKSTLAAQDCRPQDVAEESLNLSQIDVTIDESVSAAPSSEPEIHDSSSEVFNHVVDDATEPVASESNEFSHFNGLSVITKDHRNNDSDDPELDEIPNLFDDDDSPLMWENIAESHEFGLVCFHSSEESDIDHNKIPTKYIKPKKQRMIPSRLLNEFISTPDCYIQDCARLFAAVAYVVGVQHWHLLRPLFLRLHEHGNFKIRRCIAFSLFELITILGPHLSELDILPVLREYSRDVVDVREGVIHTITKITRIFSQWASNGPPSPSNTTSSSVSRPIQTHDFISQYSTQHLLVPWLKIIHNLARDSSIMPSVFINKKDVRLRHILRGGDGPAVVVSVHASHWRQQLILLNQLRKCIRERLLTIAQWQSHIVEPLYLFAQRSVAPNQNASLLLHCVTNVRLSACRLLANIFHAALCESAIESYTWYHAPISEDALSVTNLPPTLAWVKRSLDLVASMLLSHHKDAANTSAASTTEMRDGAETSVLPLSDAIAKEFLRDWKEAISESDEDNEVDEPPAGVERNNTEEQPEKRENTVFRPRQDEDGMLCAWRRRQTFLKLCLEMLHLLLKDVSRVHPQEVVEDAAMSQAQLSDRWKEILRIVVVLWPSLISPAISMVREDSVTNVRCTAVECLKHVAGILTSVHGVALPDDGQTAQLLALVNLQEVQTLLNELVHDADVQVVEVASISSESWLTSSLACDTVTGALEDLAS